MRHGRLFIKRSGYEIASALVVASFLRQPGDRRYMKILKLLAGYYLGTRVINLLQIGPDPKKSYADFKAFMKEHDLEIPEKETDEWKEEWEGAVDSLKAYNERKEIAKRMIERGYKKSSIAYVLNISEYEVGKLLG